MPQPENLALTIPEKDIRIDVYRSGGAGGQNANKTNSAVRAVHIPTGLMVCIQEERSQQTNRIRALAILQSRVYQLRKDELDAQRKSHRQAQIGNADRSEKIRTYNFPQGRITDHRINHSLFNIEAFFQGKTLEEFIQRLKLQEETRNLEGLNAVEIT
jgi:peptide chain release factor 1